MSSRLLSFCLTCVRGIFHPTPYLPRETPLNLYNCSWIKKTTTPRRRGCRALISDPTNVPVPTSKCICAVRAAENFEKLALSTLKANRGIIHQTLEFYTRTATSDTLQHLLKAIPEIATSTRRIHHQIIHCNSTFLQPAHLFGRKSFALHIFSTTLPEGNEILEACSLTSKLNKASSIAS